jgi:adenine-specific DNA-methyltransferase
LSKKPPLRIQVTTLWEYPSQHYGKGMQGDKNYKGATPSYIIWNLLKRYTQEGDTVLDPMCGSGTTLDVCKDTNRQGIGFDINPQRSDIKKNDSRKIPLKNNSVDFIFIDPPYSDNIKYSEEEACIGRINATNKEYFEEMEKVIRECHRVLKKEHHFSLYVCDYYSKKKGFVPIGFLLYDLLWSYFLPVDIISIVRHNRTLKMGNYRRAAEEENFFLRGFNYLFIMKKANS